MSLHSDAHRYRHDDCHPVVRDPMQPAVMQRDNEISRVVVEGHRTNDGDVCTLVVVQERYGGNWALYPHGWGTFGVRVDSANAQKLAAAIRDGAR